MVCRIAAAVSRTTSGGLPSVTRVTSSAAEKATMAAPGSSSITAAPWSSSAPEAAAVMASRKAADSVTRTASRTTGSAPCEGGPVTVPMLHTTDYDSRLAAYAVIVDDHDRVLLALWNEMAEPLWTLPGGGVELDETVEAAAVREVREETGSTSSSAGSWAWTRSWWRPRSGPRTGT